MRFFNVTIILLPILGEVQCYYFSEDEPHSYAVGEPVDLKVNKMTSRATFLPIDYKTLPFCQTKGGRKMDNDNNTNNLGQDLAGDRIQSSPYRLKMKEDMFCEQLCIADLGQKQQQQQRIADIYPSNKMVQAIQQKYHNNWIVDNLPSAVCFDDITSFTLRYAGGFPVGFIPEYGGEMAYIYNHVNIIIRYHNVVEKMAEADEGDDGRARIVRFTVQPFSIKHDFLPSDEEKDDDVNGSRHDDDDADSLKVADIQNPIESCSNWNIRTKKHTRYEMVNARGREPQPAHGRVLFTYDVTWEEDKWVDWPSRWDIYVTMDNAIPVYVHWISIGNTLIVLFGIWAIPTILMVRNLRSDVKYYESLVTDEQKAERILELTVWKLVHADVFRPPACSPLLLAACCGTGAQLLCTAFWVIVLAAMGFLHPARRGYFLMVMLVLYALHGSVAGYVTARFYRTFYGESWRKAVACTALGFPGIVFGVWVVVDIVAFWQESTYADIPSRAVFVLIFLWLAVSTPLVLLGAHIGYKRGAIGVLARTRRAPRQIPAQINNLPMLFGAVIVLNVQACFFEFCLIQNSMWMGHYYNTFGVLLLVLVVFVLTCAGSATCFNYFQLHGENHHWWWRSFGTAGSSGIGFFLLSPLLLQRHKMLPLSFPTAVVYLGFTGLVSLGLFLMTGFVGTSACFWFNKTIFKSIRTDSSILHVSDSDLPPASDLESRNVNNGSRMLKKALIAIFTLIALFSPSLFYPTHSDLNNHYQSRWSSIGPPKANYRKQVEIIDESDTSENKDNGGVLNMDGFHGNTSSAYKSKGEGPDVGTMRMVVTYTPVYDTRYILKTASAALLWATIIAASVISKRRSALPGGRIYSYNQTKVHKILSERMRKLRDILEDPVLREDTKRRYGDLTSLLGLVAEWQSRGFQDVQKKNEYVKNGTKIFVPWIGNMTSWLFIITYVTHFCGFNHVLSMMILPATVVHVIDNVLLYRATIAKAAPKIAENEGALAAVGIPVVQIA